MEKNRKNKKTNKVNAFYSKVNPAKYTILKQFQMFLQEKPTVQDIVGFLSVQNARLLGELSLNNNQLTSEKTKEVYEFYMYFMDNFDELTFEARMENWDDDALILRIGYDIEKEVVGEERKEFLNSLTKFQKMEADSLSRTLMNIRKNKVITFNTFEQAWQFEVPATIWRDNLEYFNEEVFIMCAEVIAAQGSIVVRTRDKNNVRELFGIAVNQKGRWEPISKEAMINAHTLAPDGTRLSPEEGLVYTEIVREKLKKDGKIVEFKQTK